MDVRADDVGAVGALVVAGDRLIDERRVDEDAPGATVRAGDGAEVPTEGVVAAAVVVAIVATAADDLVARTEAGRGELQALTDAAMVTRPSAANAARRRCRAGMSTDSPGRCEPAGIS